MLASRADYPTSSFFKFSCSVVEIPLTTSSLSLFETSKHRVKSSMDASAKEGTFTAWKTCLFNPFKLIFTYFENRIKSRKRLCRSGWEELSTPWQWRLSEEWDCLLPLSLFLLFFGGSAWATWVLSRIGSTQEIGSTFSTEE